MKYDLVLVRFGEITIKGRNRNRFETMLLNQIKLALKGMPALEYVRGYARVYIHLNGEKYEPIAERLRDIFGIFTFSPVMKSEHDLQTIRDNSLELIRSLSPSPRTFKVSVKRGWKQYPHDSTEMNHLVGAHVLRNTPDLKVDVRQPDVELKIDIQHENTYIFCEVVKGAGGFPLGMNGKAMLLLSGGIDSPVAGWMAMRKGLKVEAVHFHSYPFTSEQAKDKVVALAKRLAYYGGKINLHLVPFTELQTKLQTQLSQSGQDSLIITLMRRFMLRITEKLAERNGALAIVTGDSLGQVASQTLGSMNVIGRSSSLPLLRPLVMMDKQDIIGFAEKIGTFETSILPFEDCCTLFVPKAPAINPNLKTVEHIEAHLGDELERLIDEAVAGTEMVMLREDGITDSEEQKEDAWF
ncbi:tRNA uracil 4-sulfurtransferase ThiI [Cohnella luojiensis]|uniref:Probable tRNA sulfurtransferase n=1 Tax=Cohnella luojiensis TaxID=652876 RepID=A0A4Y8M9D7_9BACL|nr:tRNA uracil 4-sulfurtransferase ThiI [Cohnella luojiensis]TFE31699.1 tRNA 4-thiouridine(8) synthase ThiI [Cohnella luojiensis]